MTGHYMYGCDYDHFRRLLAEHQADLDPAQRGRIEECLRYSRFLTRFAKIERFFWDKRIRRRRGRQTTPVYPWSLAQRNDISVQSAFLRSGNGVYGFHDHFHLSQLSPAALSPAQALPQQADRRPLRRRYGVSAPFAPGRVLCHRQLYRRDLHPPDYLSAKLSGVYGSGF